MRTIKFRGKDATGQKTYVLTRKPDNPLAIHLSESDVTDIVVDTSELPRYHNRIFPKDYAKKKKAKCRQQKQSRRRR